MLETLETANDSIRSKLQERPNTQESDYCPHCAGTGWVRPNPDSPAVARCICLKRRIARQRLAVVLEDWPEYARARLDRMEPRLQQVNALKIMRENPNGSFLLSGYYGNGKTYLMLAQYCSMALTGGNCLLRSAKDLMDELQKATMMPSAGQEPFESPVLQLVNFSKSGHLFIDDIEKAPARSDFRAESLLDVVDKIKRRQLGITITSNLPLIGPDRSKDLRSVLGDAVVARLDKICTRIEL